MHLFIGFIQLLLILTDSRFLPDMSAFWHSAVNEERSQNHEKTGYTLEGPTAFEGSASFDIIPPTSNDKMVLAARETGFAVKVIVLNTLQPSPWVIYTSKLYLIFCQLKAEG